MEGVANTVEDRLVDGLSFQLKPGASYITERKSVTYHPQGSNIYSTNGTKLNDTECEMVTNLRVTLYMQRSLARE